MRHYFKDLSWFTPYTSSYSSFASAYSFGKFSRKSSIMQNASAAGTLNDQILSACCMVKL